MHLAGGSHGARQPDQRVPGAESDLEDRLARLRREHPQAGFAHRSFGVLGQKIVDLADFVVERFGLGAGEHHDATIAVRVGGRLVPTHRLTGLTLFVERHTLRNLAV